MAVQCLKEFTYIFGAPFRIITDQGKCFTSSEFRTFCHTFNIELHFIAHGSSRANGQVERVMQTLKNVLTTVETASEQNWQDSLGEVQLSLNSTVTGYSPAELLFGPTIRSLEIQKSCYDPVKAAEATTALAKIREIASANMVKAAANDLKRKNAGKAAIQPFSLGEFVDSKQNERMISKLDPKFRGPFKIIKVLDNDRYEVVRLTEKGKGRAFEFAHDQLTRVPDGQGHVSPLIDSDDEPLSTLINKGRLVK